MGAGSQKPHEAFVIQPAPPVGPGLAYASARAFHEAVKARLITTAEDSPYSVAELRRQFAYDRLLTRVFFTTPTTGCSKAPPVSSPGSRTKRATAWMSISTFRVSSTPPSPA